MGRHSSGSQWAYYRSVIGWLLPWLFVAALLGTGVWIAVDALGNDDIETPALASESPSPTPQVRETETPSPEPPQETSEPEPEDTEEPKAPKVELITENMTVQVLNGSGDAGADDDMANQLSGAGFEVIAVNAANRGYDLTTVFWSYAESEEAANRLAERFGWQVAPKPENLSTTVALHVVVGLDYTPR